MMLNSARGGASKTKIMYKAYLSYSQLVEYLAFLQKNRLITREEGTDLYRPTEKGLVFLKMSVELNNMTYGPNSKEFDDQI